MYKHLLVIHKKDTFCTSGEAFRGPDRFLFNAINHVWEIKGEGGAFSPCTLHRNASIMARDNAVDNCPSHPRPFARIFGREKWIKDTIDDVRIDTPSRIAHR